MAHVLSGAELTTQRLDKQWSKTYLAIPEAHTIYTARLNGVPTSNDMVAQITVNTETGTRANVLADMTMYVSAVGFGKFDLGMCRIRKTPIAGTFYVTETSEIDWVGNDGAYLTVVDDYQLWAKPVRIIAEVPYMDWDVAYSDQHASFDPVPLMGCDAVAKLVNGTVNVTLGPASDTPSWVIGSTITAYLWTCTGAVSINSATSQNTYATFNTAGTYLAYLRVTAANGKTYTGVRHIVIWDDNNPLVNDFFFRNGRMSKEGGGCSFDVTLYSGFSESSIRRRSKIILCSEDYADKTAITLPGQISGRENIVCVGWITDIDNTRTAEFGEISFTVESSEFWMKKIRDYPSGLEYAVAPATAWTGMPSLTVDRAVWHFLHWRSTATRMMDVTLTGDTRLATRFQVARANLWERIEQVGRPTIWAAAGVDNFGRFFLSIEPQMVPEADRTWANVMTFTDDDIQDPIDWTRRDVKPLAMLFFSGIAVDVSTSASSFFSMSPGHSYGHHGDEEAQDNYLVESQANSNQLCGLYYGWRNNDPENLNVNFTHSMRILGIWPNQKYHFEISAANDPRGIGVNKDFIVREINFQQNPDSGFIEYSASLESESVEGPAINGDIPTAEMQDIDFSTPGDINFPKFPPLPPFPPYIGLPPTVQPANQPTTVVIGTSKGVLYTTNFNDALPTWRFMNTGLDTGRAADIYNLIVTPKGAIYIHLYTYNEVWRAPEIGGTFVLIAQASDFTNRQIGGIGANPIDDDVIGIAGLGALSVSGQFRLSDAGVLITDETTTLRQEPLSVTFGDDKWYVCGSHYGFLNTPWINVYSSDGTPGYNASINSAIGQDAAARYAVQAGTQDKLYQWDGSGAGGFNVITGAGTIITRMTSLTPVKNNQGLAFSPTGAVGMGAQGTTPYLTTDSGTTWSSVAGVIPVGSDIWEDCNDDYRFIFGGGVIVRLTMDQGASYVDKSGNLIYINGLIDVTHIRFLA